MKKNNLSFPIFLLLPSLIIGLLAGCRGDNPSNADTLPAGKHPITLATSLEGMPTTHGTVEGTWQGGEVIIGTISNMDGDQLFYGIMNSDGTSQLSDESRNPLYWKNTTEVYKVLSYYPIDFQGVKADQNLLANHLASDYLLGVGQLSFGSRSPLLFEHQMAKVTVALIAGEGIADLATAVVSFHSQVNVADGDSKIIPYQNATALLPPQKVVDAPFISVDLDHFVYAYTPTSPTEVNLEAGKSYLYTVTVSKTGLTVELTTFPTWGDSGTTEDVVSKLIDPTFVITNLKIGDYYYSDGTWSDGGYRMYTDGSNGRLLINPLPGKVCIGIVFQTDLNRISRSDRDQGFKAYVMALADADEPALWGPDIDEHSDATYIDNVFDTNINELIHMYKDQEGLRATRFIIEKYGADGCESLKTDYKAFYNVSQFGETTATQSFAAPKASSGWFLPSGGQWCSILEMLGNRDMEPVANGEGTIISLNDPTTTRNNLNQWLMELPLAQPFTFSGYWTTTEITYYNVYVFAFFYEIRLYNGNKNDKSTKTRCILAF